jgi:hypothetical protein
MFVAICSNLPNRPVYRHSRRRALLLGAVVAMSLVAVPAAAQASSRTGSAPSHTKLASSYCSKVSAASVSTIVGHPVPAGSPSTEHLSPTKANHEISAVVLSCTYGAETNMAALTKDVFLSLEVTSKPLTGAELEYALSQAEKLKIKLTPYSGLGTTAYYYTFTDAAITVQGMIAISGTNNYSAAIYTKTQATSELAALVKLAEKL